MKFIRENLNLTDAIKNSDKIVIGAGAGLSTSAGLTYDGFRFQKYFFDFIEKYSFDNAYYAGFYPFQRSEEKWAYWSRYIYINRYESCPNDTYSILYDIIKDKDYFVLTTNVDHMFQRSGFDKDRLFYTQGDYGLFQCSIPCHNSTYDNEKTIENMLLSQGFEISESKDLLITRNIRMEIDKDLIPRCPKCNKEMSMNLRADDTFVEDDGWHAALKRYENFLTSAKGKRILYLELGVGANTPGIIKYPFWRMTYNDRNAVYCTINKGEAFVPSEIKERSIAIEDDIGSVLKRMRAENKNQ